MVGTPGVTGPDSLSTRTDSRTSLTPSESESHVCTGVLGTTIADDLYTTGVSGGGSLPPYYWCTGLRGSGGTCGGAWRSSIFHDLGCFLCHSTSSINTCGKTTRTFPWCHSRFPGCDAPEANQSAWRSACPSGWTVRRCRSASVPTGRWSCRHSLCSDSPRPDRTCRVGRMGWVSD